MTAGTYAPVVMWHGAFKAAHWHTILKGEEKMYTYSDLHFYEWMLCEGIQPKSSREAVENRIIEMKRYIRKHNRPDDSGRVIVKDDGIDGYIVKFPFPESIKTREDAVEYFEEYERIHFYPTPWDCSGQAFTGWYKIFKKPDGRFWAYHAIRIDC